MTPERPLSRPHFVVRAAAGTGKTWLLTGRIVRFLLQGVRPGSILAITFTQKAAKEIQGRVMERLRALATIDDANMDRQLDELALRDPESRQRARRLYEDILLGDQRLRACTFHAFCQDLLRRFPLEAGIIPGFELLENTGELDAEAWAVLEREARTGAGPVADALETLLDACDGLANLRQALNDFLQHRSDWWAYTETSADPLAEAVAHLDRALQIPAIDPLDAPQITEWLARYSGLLDCHRTDTHAGYIDAIARALAPGISIDERRALLTPVFLKVDGDPRSPSARLRDLLGAERVQEFDRVRENLIGALRLSHDAARKRETLRASRAWYSCGQQLLFHYQRLKQERNLLDFSDLEWKAYQLLNRSEHAEWVQYKLDQRIDHLLVDEFQDTNPTQWRLLLPLLEEMAAGDGMRDRSVFLVGDEKQSIYRFRRAQPALFSVAQRWLADRLRAETGSQARSYRSSPAIVAFVNLVFDRHEAASPLPGYETHHTHLADLWGHAELLPLIPDAPPTPAPRTGLRDPLARPREVPRDRRYEHEGERLARMIRELVGDVVVGRGETARPAHYGDILVLVRERTQALYFEQALRRAGIPYLGLARTRLVDCLEIRDLLRLLQLFLDPEDDLALASVLKSPIFSADDADLMRIAETAQARGTGWLACLRAPADLPETSTLGRAGRLLATWAARADRIPVHDLLDGIFCEGNVVERYVAAAPLRLRPRVRANLNRLLDLALGTDSGRFPSLARFLTRIRSGTDEAETGTTTASGQDQRVRLMTIHAAKGLEAPVVFLMDAARRPRQERGVRALIEWPPDAPQPSHFHLVGKKDSVDSMSSAVLARQLQVAEQEENNLLYVALTRAKQILFVSGCAPRKDRDRFWYGQIESRLRTASATAGLRVTTLPDAAGEPCNTIGVLAFGEQPPAAPTVTVSRPPAPLEVDPALTCPLPVASASMTVRPSESAAESGRAEAGFRARERGVAIHRALQLIAGTTDRDAARREFEAQFHTAFDRPALDACWREAGSVVDAPNLRALFDPAQFERAENELPLLYLDGGREVSGVIDRLVFTPTGIILVDYKTHEGVRRDDLDALSAAYAGQMRLYVRGVMRLWPQRPVRALLLFTALAETVDVALPGSSD